jgi:hypothetical protein
MACATDGRGPNGDSLLASEMTSVIAPDAIRDGVSDCVRV